MLGILTETCPERKLGLMGDVMEMDGPTFCESKELEPAEHIKLSRLTSCPNRFKLAWTDAEHVPSRTNSLEFS